MDVTESADPEGLRVFYYLVQDLKALVFSLISLHFKVRAGDWERIKNGVLTLGHDRSSRYNYQRCDVPGLLGEMIWVGNPMIILTFTRLGGLSMYYYSCTYILPL